MTFRYAGITTIGFRILNCFINYFDIIAIINPDNLPAICAESCGAVFCECQVG